MRNPTVLFYILIFVILAPGCEKSDTDLNSEIKDGFNLLIDNSFCYNINYIDFYDFSSHLIYLKKGSNFSYSDNGAFSVKVDHEEIYTGQIFSMSSSCLPIGPVIRCAPSFYNDYIIPIGFNRIIDKDGNSNEDPRNDSRIIEALKKYNQYKNGISSEITSIQKLSDNKVKIEIKLINLDTDNLLILDPDKMGLELFHYFTNGLIISDSQNKSYTHKLTIEKPEPWDSWKNDWLTELKGNEIKTFTITYTDFDGLPSGEYTAMFNYPGLGSQIEKDELQQDNGRIWLGQLNITKIIDVE